MQSSLFIELLTLLEIKSLTQQDIEIIDCIFANHHIRINYEQKAPATQKIDLKGIIKKNISPPNPTKAVFIYLTERKGCWHKEEYERVYGQFKDSLEVTDKGKIVAIDIDTTCIIGSYEDYRNSK